MTNVVPFPRPEKRKRLARRAWKALRDRACSGGRCVGCCLYFGVERLTAHHVYGRDLGGDDILENLVPLCGSGTTGCHGATETGERCVDADGTAHDPDVVNARIRRFVAESHGHCLYLVKKLGGPDQARSFLDRYYPERPGAPDTTGGLDHAA